MRIILAVMICVAVAACSRGRTETGQIFIKPGDPRIETAAICDNGGIEERVRNYRSAARGIDVDDYSSTNRNQTDRMRDFEAAVDAQYRAVTSTCKAYARCMEANLYNEGACRSSAARWELAEERFNRLAVDLEELENEARRGARQRGYGKNTTVNRQETCDCSKSVGGVFANCCN